jgi:hypothetical protein
MPSPLPLCEKLHCDKQQKKTSMAQLEGQGSERGIASANETINAEGVAPSRS